MLGFYNGGRITIMSSNPVIYGPRWLHPSYTKAGAVGDRITRYDSFLQCCEHRKPRVVCLYRTYALGDILMLLPIARRLHRLLRLGEPIRIVVQARHLDNLRPMACPEYVFLRKREPFDDYGADVHYSLDSCLEADHRGGPASDMHRMALYGQALGIEVLPHEPELRASRVRRPAQRGPQGVAPAGLDLPAGQAGPDTAAVR